MVDFYRIGQGGEELPGPFTVGQLVATPGALRAMMQAGANPYQLIQRHLRLDWDDLDLDDRELNVQALKDGSRIFGKFVLATKEVLWCITEAESDDGQRESTCLLLPDEY